ncbi:MULTISPECIES: hypothetical protein [Mycobacteriaceae]|uniref:hypothetical protein n=1 Tax=Mycobacteriaceae TaxID=1762 RepID=UPI0029395411|nr:MULTISPECIES: hypothetical protein [Mycobacteriaceae]MDV3136732.1 hypothetical protein [Mycobacterium sp. 29Ha]WSE55947.1 hypothetical protein QGN32_21720 [Mycolicibacterium sp. ND9-15]
MDAGRTSAANTRPGGLWANSQPPEAFDIAWGAKGAAGAALAGAGAGTGAGTAAAGAGAVGMMVAA